MSDEIWRVIGFAPGYEVSNCGRVRSFRPVNGRGPLLSIPRLLKHAVTSKGYHQVGLMIGGRLTSWKVNRLVALAFIGDPPNETDEARHLDDVKSNNTVGNIAWGTRAENAADAVRNGRYCRGENHGRAVLSDDDVRRMFTLQDSGWSFRKIGRELGVSATHVARVLSGEQRQITSVKVV